MGVVNLNVFCIIFVASVILVCCISHFKRIKYTSAHTDIYIL